LQLARNRGLWTPGPDVAERRRQFAESLHDVLRRLSVVHRIAVARVERSLATQETRTTV
jgi:hypothetical protein